VDEWSDATESLLLISSRVTRQGDLIKFHFIMFIDLILVSVSLRDASMEIRESGVDYVA